MALPRELRRAEVPNSGQLFQLFHAKNCLALELYEREATASTSVLQSSESELTAQMWKESLQLIASRQMSTICDTRLFRIGDGLPRG